MKWKWPGRAVEVAEAGITCRFSSLPTVAIELQLVNFVPAPASVVNGARVHLVRVSRVMLVDACRGSP